MKDYKLLQDDELVALYASGDNEAFGHLLKKNKDRVFAYIHYSVKTREVCEDIFQESFVKAIAKIKQGKYVSNGHFFAWICRIAHNLIIDYFRRTQCCNIISSDDNDATYKIDVADDNNFEEIMLQRQVLQDVSRLVDTLPNTQKEVLRMRFYEDLSFKEIAEKTGVSVNTALGRMRYAVINMRRIVEERNISLEV